MLQCHTPEGPREAMGAFDPWRCCIDLDWHILQYGLCDAIQKRRLALHVIVDCKLVLKSKMTPKAGQGAKRCWTMLREKREALVREHMSAENDLDFVRTMAPFSHPRYELIASGTVHDGKADVDHYFVASRKVFPDQRNELISLRHADDAVIVEFWLMGTHKGRMGNIEPTGREIRVRMVAFYLFDDHGITCERVYFDQMTIMRQLGLLPEAA